MHDTAMEYGKKFFDSYVKNVTGLTIVDIGSQDVNGSLRSVSPKNNKYIGVDFARGKGVDLVINDPYSLPFENDSVDVIVSSSCFEHSEFFWLLFNECLRVLKPTGILYINVPSDGAFHGYPVDCWRFYPDSGLALQNWGRRSGYKCALLESFIGVRRNDVWHDFVAVFVKDDSNAPKYTDLIQANLAIFKNGHTYNSEKIINYSDFFHDEGLLTSKAHFFLSLKKLVPKKLKPIALKIGAFIKKG